MPASESYAAGDVVVVPFPYADRLAEKRRPALVVSGAALARSGFVWLAMITSARTPTLADDLPIEDLEAAGLPAASVVRPVKIACVEPLRIVRRAGRLSDGATESIVARVRSFIG